MIDNRMFTCDVDVVGQLSGLVTLPSDYNPEKEKLPVIVFLHGAGERYRHGDNLFDLITTHGIPKYFSTDCNYLGLRVITFSPVCPEDYIWDNILFALKTWIENAIKQFGGDSDRISLTGISMGGFGTWNMITTFPGMFKLAAPICGGGVSWRVPCIKNTKIRAFHGIDDSSVPIEYSILMVRAAKSYGIDASLTTFDNVGHNSWDPAYETTDIIKWLAFSSD